MGDYNADKNYNLPQSVVLIRDFFFVPEEFLRFDQWTVDSAHRVSSFHDGTGLVKVHIAFDPRQVP